MEGSGLFHRTMLRKEYIQFEGLNTFQAVQLLHPSPINFIPTSRPGEARHGSAQWAKYTMSLVDHWCRMDLGGASCMKLFASYVLH